MTHEENGAAFLPACLVHLPQTLFLEGGVADREHFIDHENFRIEMRGDRECEPHIHAAAVMLDRGVEKPFHLGESDDLVEAPPHLGASHAEDDTI